MNDTLMEPTADSDVDILSASEHGSSSASVTGALYAGDVAAHEPATAVQSLASRLRCTEGQLYSMVIGLAAATALSLTGGVPLGDPPASPAALPAPTIDGQAPAPGVVVVPTPQPSAPTLGQLPVGSQATPLPPTSASQPEPVTGPGQPDVTPPVAFPALLTVPTPGQPRAVVSDGTRLFVGTDNSGPAPSQLLVYGSSGRLFKRITITGQTKNHVGGLTAAAVRGSSVLVADRSRGALVQVDPISGRQQLLATLPDLPPCLVGITGTCQPGVQDHPPTPEGLLVAGKYAYVADAGQGTIWRYDFASHALSAWYSSSDLSLAGPAGLAVDTAGNVLFTVAQSADTAALDKGALYRLAVGSDGTAGARSLVATFDTAAQVGPLAVGRADDAYVALRGTGSVAVVSRTGTVTPLSGGASAALPSPTGLTLVDGQLLVADVGKPSGATSGRVHAIAVSDGPAF